MIKQIIKSDFLNEQYIKIKHQTGLNILLYPMNNYNSSYVLFGTKYGSIDRSFKLNGEKEFTVVPDGIAHFLEHKLFESEDGDAFSLFAKTGASANAYTSFEKTCYLFSCVDNFEQSLEYLLTFVRQPYFTKESVEKEQGIIGQEIEMYNDSGSWRVFFNLLQAMYHKNPIRIDIAGTKESISKIDNKVLYKCYYTFYNLNNMVLAITGNFDVDNVLKIVDKCIKPDEDIKIEREEYIEDENVFQEEIVQNLEVYIPLFNIGYKSVSYSGKELLKAEIESKFILDIISSESSTLYKKMYDQGLINSTFSSEVLSGPGYFAIIFSGESKDPRQVFEKIKLEVESIKEKGISEKIFKRVKKSLYGQYIRMFNNVEAVASSMISSYFNDVCVYDSIDILNNLTLFDLINRINISFDNKKTSISIVDVIKK